MRATGEHTSYSLVVTRHGRAGLFVAPLSKLRRPPSRTTRADRRQSEFYILAHRLSAVRYCCPHQEIHLTTIFNWQPRPPPSADSEYIILCYTSIIMLYTCCYCVHVWYRTSDAKSQTMRYDTSFHFPFRYFRHPPIVDSTRVDGGHFVLPAGLVETCLASLYVCTHHFIIKYKAHLKDFI